MVTLIPWIHYITIRILIQVMSHLFSMRMYLDDWSIVLSNHHGLAEYWNESFIHIKNFAKTDQKWDCFEIHCWSRVGKSIEKSVTVFFTWDLGLPVYRNDNGPKIMNKPSVDIQTTVNIKITELNLEICFPSEMKTEPSSQRSLTPI